MFCGGLGVFFVVVFFVVVFFLAVVFGVVSLCWCCGGVLE